MSVNSYMSLRRKEPVSTGQRLFAYPELWHLQRVNEIPQVSRYCCIFTDHS